MGSKSYHRPLKQTIFICRCARWQGTFCHITNKFLVIIIVTFLHKSGDCHLKNFINKLVINKFCIDVRNICENNNEVIFITYWFGVATEAALAPSTNIQQSVMPHASDVQQNKMWFCWTCDWLSCHAILCHIAVNIQYI